jgi:hypothetical protein
VPLLSERLRSAEWKVKRHSELQNFRRVLRFAGRSFPQLRQIRSGMVLGAPVVDKNPYGVPRTAAHGGTVYA